MLKRLTRCLTLCVFLWFFSAVAFAAPVHAQLVGTHLGEGDPGAQADIMRMIKSKGAPEGFPVTIQVSSGVSPEQLQLLSSTVQETGFFPIVRIDDVCDKAVPGVVDRVRQAFGPDAVIAFGNEINNQDVECKDWGRYTTNFSIEAGKQNVAPSALDAYMGLPQFQINTLFSNQPSLNGLYSTANVRVGNAYGCVSTRVGDCDPTTTTTQNIGIQAVPGITYLTEFSLSPESRVADAPDTDLKKVVDFIETQGPKAATDFGVKKITPLIRNVCNGDGEWLVYLGGSGADSAKVFTKSGSEINIETCSGDTTLAPYYLYPIKGVNEKDKNLMKADMYAQGYQAYCTTPKMDVRAVVNNLTDYLYEQVDENQDYLITDFSFGADFSQLQVPLWRDNTSQQTVMSSIENFWGHLDTTTVGEEQRINSARLYTLTTLEQQCTLKTNLLNTVKTMCDGLENPESCPLYDTLPGSNLTFKDMIEKLPKAKQNGFTCEDYGNGEWESKLGSTSFKPNGVSREELVTFTDNVNLIPFYLDKAYRLGFVVLSLELKKPLEPDKAKQPFTFLRGTGDIGSYDTIHEVRILPFKLPDIGTNRDPDSPIYYEDALQITRNLLLTPDQLAKIEDEYDRKRTQVADLHTHIDCKNNSDYCENNVLVQGLVEFVNEKLERSAKQAYQGKYPAPECELAPDQVPMEEVEELFGLGNLSESDGTIVATANLTQSPAGPGVAENSQPQPDTVESLREQYIGQQIPFNPTERDTPTFGTTELPFKFLSEADAEVREGTVSHPPDEAAGKTLIRTYLIVPQGYQLRTVEDALASAFPVNYIDAFNEARDNETIPHYLPLENTGYTQPDSGFPQTKTVTHTNPDYCEVDELTGAVKCSTEILKNDVTIEYQESNPGILGGTLGYLMRQLAKVPLTYDDVLLRAVDKCETTEDYLIGVCSEKDKSKRPNSLGDAPVGDLTAACSDMYGTQTSVVYDQQTVFRKVVAIANARGIDPKLLWGIYRIEGGPYRNMADTLAPGEIKTINCAELINSCGAVGPMQIIQGACVTEECPSAYKDELKTYVRPTSLCNIDDALNEAAHILQQNIPLAGNDPFKLAGRYHGLATYDQPRCGNAAPVQGCSEVEEDGTVIERNYCECAVEGFDQQFDNMANALGIR